MGLLEPLAIAFGLPHLRYVAGTKVHGDTSTLCIGPVGTSNEGPHLWRTARGRCSDVSVQGPAGVRVPDRDADPAPRAAVPATWTSRSAPASCATGSSPGARWSTRSSPILGRRREPGRREFDVEDGRVVSLALHHDVDPLLGNAVDVDVRWRLVGRAEGPTLDYDVRRAVSA